MYLRRRSILGGVLFTLLILSLLASLVVAAPQTRAAHNQAFSFHRVTAGQNGVGGGSYTSLSADGRYVAFESSAHDLVSGWQDSSWDTYVHDRYASASERVSARADGSAVYNAGEYTAPPRLSGSGRHVVFVSMASDLVPGDNNAMPDIFRKDRQTGQVLLVTVGLNGAPANGDSYNPAITPDGRYVAFQSYASNLVAGDSNDAIDVFVRDLQAGTTERVSVTDAGEQGHDPHDIGGFSSVAISDDGRYVAFSYQNLPAGGGGIQPGENRPGLYLHDRQNRTTRFVAPGEYPALSGSGRYLAFVSDAALSPSDSNQTDDVYRFDRQSGTFEQISVGSNGEQAGFQLILSAPAISADGSKIAFETSSDELSPDDNNGQSDIYLRDTVNGTTRLVSASPVGGAANGPSHSPSISADGSIIAFCSRASNLVPDDTNNRFDVFITSAPEFSVIQPVMLYLPLLQN